MIWKSILLEIMHYRHLIATEFCDSFSAQIDDARARVYILSVFAHVRQGAARCTVQQQSAFFIES